jgi:hypothetical protein
VTLTKDFPDLLGLTLGQCLGPTQFLPIAPGPRQTSVGTFDKQITFHFCYCRKGRQDYLSGSGGEIEVPELKNLYGASSILQALYHRHNIWGISTKPVQLADNQTLWLLRALD